MQLIFSLPIFFAILAKLATLNIFSPEWILAIATVGLAIATVILIFFTYRHGKHLARNQENLVIAQTALVEEQKKQVENQQRLIDLEGQQQKFSSLIQFSTS